VILPTDVLNAQLPKWIRFSGEERLRFEDYHSQSFVPGSDDGYLLQRFRLNLTLLPGSIGDLPVRIFVQTQDSRVFWRNTIPGPPLATTWDLRQAFGEIGDFEKSRVALRVGRQELGFGDERLIGPAQWSNTARTFDAARLTLRQGPVRLDLFASAPVILHDGEVGSVTPGNNLHGAFVTFSKLVPGATVQPFVFWKLAPSVKLEAGGTGRNDLKVSGVYWAGKRGNLDYSTTMAIERGHDYRSGVSEGIEAWGGFWIAGYTFAKARFTPRVFADTTQGSGDQDPKDGVHGTFDSLYPSAHDKVGFADVFGWRNIRHVRGGLDLRTSPKWFFTVRHSALWLASARDALYTPQGAVIVQKADGSAGGWIGQESDVLATYAVSKFAQANAGVSHIFPGTFLDRATPGKGYTGVYLMFTTRF
jgi:hypothetical protein